MRRTIAAMAAAIPPKRMPSIAVFENEALVAITCQ
jgi:hypothetical protein